jgi:hypothetical protein
MDFVLRLTTEETDLVMLSMRALQVLRAGTYEAEIAREIEAKCRESRGGKLREYVGSADILDMQS